MDTPTRRQDYRLRTYIGARIVYDGGRRSLTCLVRNRSVQGASLQVSDGVLIPHDFEIVMSDHARARQARMVWRKNGAMGVRFAESAPTNIVPFPTRRSTGWLGETRDALQLLSRDLSNDS
jgi:hypothetical protein